MSKGQTKGDDCGYERGEKGYAEGGQWDKNDDGVGGSYDKSKQINRERPVGQFASVGSGKNLKQRGY